MNKHNSKAGNAVHCLSKFENSFIIKLKQKFLLLYTVAYIITLIFDVNMYKDNSNGELYKQTTHKQMYS